MADVLFETKDLGSSSSQAFADFDRIGGTLDGVWSGLVQNAGDFAGSFQGAIEGMKAVSMASQATDILINIASKVTSMHEKVAGKVGG